MYVEMVNDQDKIPTRNGLHGIFIHLVHGRLKNRRVIYYLTKQKIRIKSFPTEIAVTTRVTQ